MPQTRLSAAVNVNAWQAVPPSAGTTPKFFAPSGLVTPPPARSVPTTLKVLPPPVFLMQKLTVTVSPGSIAPFGGKQLSPCNVGVLEVIAGTPRMQPATFVSWVSTMLITPVAVIG